MCTVNLGFQRAVVVTATEESGLEHDQVVSREEHLVTPAGQVNLTSDIARETTTHAGKGQDEGETEEESSARNQQKMANVPLELDVVGGSIMPADLKGKRIVKEMPRNSDNFMVGTVTSYWSYMDKWVVHFSGEGKRASYEREEIRDMYQMYTEDPDYFEELTKEQHQEKAAGGKKSKKRTSSSDGKTTEDSNRGEEPGRNATELGKGMCVLIYSIQKLHNQCFALLTHGIPSSTLPPHAMQM